MEKVITQGHKVTRNIICESAQMQAALRSVNRVAPTKATVLITGETGVGKEVIAEAIHDKSPRSNGPLKIINCGAISSELIQSELFGHERGAFTTAIRRHHGIFEQADGGTLFLDEVADMPPAAQAKFLRVLEQEEFSPLGSEKVIKVDVRVIAATNVNLKMAVNKRVFREDLYYRLNLFRIQIPPLRNRRSDIVPLALNFISEFSRAYNKSITDITPEAVKCLQNADWHGNVRELRNVIETAIILTEGEELEKADIAMVLENLNDFNETPHTIPENAKEKLWELVQTGTISEITSYITLMRYETERSDYSKQAIAKRLQISVPTLDKYCALAEENTQRK